MSSTTGTILNLLQSCTAGWGWGGTEPRCLRCQLCPNCLKWVLTIAWSRPSFQGKALELCWTGQDAELWTFSYIFWFQGIVPLPWEDLPQECDPSHHQLCFFLLPRTAQLVKSASRNLNIVQPNNSTCQNRRGTQNAKLGCRVSVNHVILCPTNWWVPFVSTLLPYTMVALLVLHTEYEAVFWKLQALAIATSSRA